MLVLPDSRQIIDLAHPLNEKTPFFPGDPPLELSSLATVESDGYQLTAIQSVFHTGTHLDAPSHFIKNGSDIQDWPLNLSVGKAMVIPCSGYENLPASLLDHCAGWQDCDFLLFHTDWGKQYGKPGYFIQHPVFSEELGRCLANSTVKVIGMDLPSPDQAPYPIHHLWARAGKYILENLCNLDQVPSQTQFTMICIPLPFAVEASWVRPLAIIP
jgi:kynurenine formamidase